MTNKIGNQKNKLKDEKINLFLISDNPGNHKVYAFLGDYNVEIEAKIAHLMLSAIISDTLLLKSPTTTEDDKLAVEKLAEIAEIDVEEYGLEMLKAGTDLSSFSIEEILSLDAKQIDFKDVKSIVNQVNTADISDVMALKDDLEEGMNVIDMPKEVGIYIMQFNYLNGDIEVRKIVVERK